KMRCSSLFPFLFCLSVSLIHTESLFLPQELTHVQKSAHEWATQCCKHLDQDQLCLTANILYLTYAKNTADLYAHLVNSELFRTSQEIRTHTLNYEPID